MALLKKLLKIVGITLLVLLGIVVILIVCMMIFPDFQIFGHRYIGNSTINGSEEKYEIIAGEEYNLIANTQVFDVNITENDTNSIVMSYTDRKWGFATVSRSQLAVKDNGYIIEARMLETTGLVFGSGVLNISIPKTAKFHLNLNTLNGNIYINSANVASLTASLNSGELLWKAEQEVIVTPEDTDTSQDGVEATAEDGVEEDTDNTTEDSTDSDTEDGTDDKEESSETPEEEPAEPKTEIVPIKEVEVGSIQIHSNSPNIDFSCFDTITVNGDFSITANKLNLKFGTLTSNLQLNCNTLNLDIDNIVNTGELFVISKNGKINIGSISSIEKSTIVTETTSINIQEVNSPIYLKTSTGSVNINKAIDAIYATTVSGQVRVVSAERDVHIETTSGDIKVDACYQNAFITTKTGSVNIHNKGEENGGITTNITQESGDITAISEGNSLQVESSKGSSVDATIRRMHPNKAIQHKISNKLGDSKVSIILEDYPFEIRAVGEVSGELGPNVVMNSNTQYVLYEPVNYTGTTSDMSSISVTGGKVFFVGIYE